MASERTGNYGKNALNGLKSLLKVSIRLLKDIG